MLKEAIAAVSERTDLDRETIAAVFEEIFAGRASPAQIGALLIALRMKGETIEEVTGAALALRRRAHSVSSPPGRVVLDTCGTGGDGSGTFNISTAVAFVAAAAGVTVAKHGNARFSSRCGSADVLAAAGVSLDASAPRVERCLAEIGVAFLFAPKFHPVMKEVASARRDLGVRSIFNILGPLANPARAKRQLIGVYARSLLPIVAGALAALWTDRSLVIHGEDGLDEVSPAGATLAMLVEGERITPLTLRPEDADVEPFPIGHVQGGDAMANAKLLRELLGGAPGPTREVVVLNAAAALWVASVSPSLKDGASRARIILDDGSALAKLDALAAMTAAAAEGAVTARSEARS
jgi:anthranilate phosphoribosyltransferase